MNGYQGVARGTGSCRFILLSGLLLLVACAQGGAVPQREAPIPKTHVVEINKFRFHPEKMMVRAGDTIRWVNKDIVPHRVAHTIRRKWESGDLKRDDVFSQRIQTSTAYICTLHPGMHGEIIVAEE